MCNNNYYNANKNSNEGLKISVEKIKMNQKKEIQEMKKKTKIINGIKYWYDSYGHLSAMRKMKRRKQRKVKKRIKSKKQVCKHPDQLKINYCLECRNLILSTRERDFPEKYPARFVGGRRK